MTGEAELPSEAPLPQFGKARTLAELNAIVAKLEHASAAGCAAATAQCALLECRGLGRPVDWSRALDRLQLAAEQGCERAARQLLLFAGLDLPSETAGKDDWRNIRSRIDERHILGRRQGEIAFNRPFVAIVEEFATPAECRWLIEAARERLAPSTVYDRATGDFRADQRRTSSAAMFSIDDTALVVEAIRTRIAATVESPLDQFEVPQVLHYSPGQEFKPHHDYFNPAAAGFQEEIGLRGQRIATFLIYLNDDFTGGETRFPELGFSYRGSTGDAMAFAKVDPGGRPNPRTLHAGLPPKSGEKWIFSQWVRDRPPRAAAEVADHE